MGAVEVGGGHVGCLGLGWAGGELFERRIKVGSLWGRCGVKNCVEGFMVFWGVSSGIIGGWVREMGGIVFEGWV